MVLGQRGAAGGGGIDHPAGRAVIEQDSPRARPLRQKIDRAQALRNDGAAAVTRVDLLGFVPVDPGDEAAAEEIQGKAVILPLARRIRQRAPEQIHRRPGRLEAV